MANSNNDKNANLKSYKDASLIMDHKNFDTVLPKLTEVLILEYDQAGRILQLRRECPPTMSARAPAIQFADPDYPTIEEQLLADEQLELRKIHLGLVAKDIRRYEQQKPQMATRILMQCSALLKLEVEKHPTFSDVCEDPLKMVQLLQEIVHLGDGFGFREHVKQIMVLARANMNEKANLIQFSKRFTTEFEILQSMLIKLKLNSASKPTMTIEDYVTKLIAAFYIEALPKSFDEVRKDISNENMTSVSQPDNLQQAIKLADQYDNIKAGSMLSNPSSNNKSPSDNLAGAITNPNNRKPPGNKPPGDKVPADKNRERIIYTDPKVPPPKPWNKMAYCAHCKRWCSHTIDTCKNKAAGKLIDIKDGKKPGKVVAVTYDDETNSVWGMSVKK